MRSRCCDEMEIICDFDYDGEVVSPTLAVRLEIFLESGLGASD